LDSSDTAAGAPGGQVGYIELLRGNRDFRNIWLGQVVSQLGDWFNTIALYTLVLELTGSGRAVALVLVLRFLPSTVLAPLAGAVADRFDRRRVMILSDLGRAVVVLGFLFVRTADDLWLVYTLTILQLGLSAFFEPARSAVLPSVVKERELVTANTITSVTWSAMLTLGAAVGGVMTAAFGATAAFVLDSLTYLLSALIIAAVRLPPRAPREKKRLTVGRALGLTDTLEGAAYVRRRPRVLALLLVKPAWCVGGGILTLLAVFGERVFPLGGKTALGVSALYAARGVGTAVGPVFARRFASGTRGRMQSAIGWSFVVGGVFYALFGAAPSFWLAAFCVAAAHMGGSILWGFSTVLLQASVADDFRGRVFAAELMLISLMLAAANYATGEALDRFRVSPRAVAVATGLFFILPGVVWLLTRRWWDRD
jgi:predicted MFS family arabinose efflux permease